MNDIPMELTLLGAAVVIGLIQVVWTAVAGAKQRDPKWLAGPRDEPVLPLTGVAGRLDRALSNFKESFPLFAAAVLAVTLAGKLGPLTLWGSALYVAGRALYVPVYAAGVPMIRTLVWLASMVGLIMILVALFG